MDKRTAAKAYKIQLEVASDKLARATRLCSNIDSDSKWKAFDEACKEADFLVIAALRCVPNGFLPEEDEKKLISSLKELHTIRIEALINWQTAWREAEAIRNPTGKYGVKRARRLKLEADLAADGNGHQGILDGR